MHFDMQTWSKQSAEVKPIIRMGKKGDLSDIDYGIDVGARRAGLSFSETADLQGFLNAQPSQRMVQKRENIQ